MKKEYIFRLVLSLAVFFLVYQFGFKPIINDSENDTSILNQNWSARVSENSSADFDLIVYGGEPQGISAAISAARLGARTLLISEGKDAGGIVTRALLSQLEVPLDAEGRMLNGGILSEFNNKLGPDFSDSEYLSTIEKMLEEKNLSLLYNTKITGVSESDGIINSVEVLSDGNKVSGAGENKKVITARMFIDASDSSRLLDICKVPYITGSGDLNMETSYMPVGLNFEMKFKGSSIEKDITEAKELVKNQDLFYKGLKDYKRSYIKTRIDGLSFYFNGENSLIVSGLQISDVDVLNEEDMKIAYDKAGIEAKNLASFLSAKFYQFKNWSFSRAAPGFRVEESKHFKGKYTLSVKDILDNRFFERTVAMGSYPIRTNKFAKGGVYIAGKGIQYGIPLDSLIPEKGLNLLMAGPRISYSSLVASSAGTLGTSIATGEAAGITAVFCLSESESPLLVINERDDFKRLKTLLLSRKMYLPNKKLTNKFADNWSYPYARQLVSLGLVAGGSSNDLKYGINARQKDLAYILINGIYRLDKNKYSLEMDARLRPFIKEEKLTFKSAVSILGALYDVKGSTDHIYEKLCTDRRINDVMQLRLKERKALTMDDVYYLGAYSIQSYTGKEIQ